jgi:hypothetical protein
MLRNWDAGLDREVAILGQTVAAFPCIKLRNLSGVVSPLWRELNRQGIRCRVRASELSLLTM